MWEGLWFHRIQSNSILAPGDFIFISGSSRFMPFANSKHFSDIGMHSLFRRGKVKFIYSEYMDRVKRIWYLSPMRAAKVQASLRIRAVLPEPPLLAHTSSESRGIFRQKARSLAPLNGWVCAVKICHDGMLEDINSLDGAHMKTVLPVTLNFRFSTTWTTMNLCQALLFVK